MIKEIFDNSGEKLREIVYKKLAEKEGTQEEIAVVEMELAMMKRWGDEKRFLFLHELTKQMKEMGVYFSARGLFCTSFYCSYLLGILEYNPLKYSLSYQAYMEGTHSIELNVEEGGYEKVIDFLASTFGEEKFYRTTYCDVRTKQTGVSGRTYLLSSGVPPLEKMKIGGITALTAPNKRKEQVGNYFTFALLIHPMLDFIKSAEKMNPNAINYHGFEDARVFEYMHKVPFSQFCFDGNEVTLQKPRSIRALADCQYKITAMTEKNLGDRISYAVQYYKLAHLKMQFAGLFEEWAGAEKKASSSKVTINILGGEEKSIVIHEDYASTGWRCVGVTDMRLPSVMCQLCGKHLLRYVHHMEHVSGKKLDVGCICAGNLEGDIEKAKRREESVKNNRQNIGNPPKKREYQFSRGSNGNYYKKVNEQFIVVYPDKEKAGYWSYATDGVYSQSSYPDKETAMAAAIKRAKG